MKSKFDLKHSVGKVTPENPDDLWILDSILREGDLIRARTPRSQDILRDGKKVRGKKVLVTLTVQLEKKEFDSVLKLRGKIIDGPDWLERGYHTIEASANNMLTIQRAWKSWEVDKIKKAGKKSDPVVVVILDEREADFYRVSGKSQHLLNIRGQGLGKGGEDNKRDGYLKEVADVLEKQVEKNVVVAGPGFAREDLVKSLKTDKKIILEGCSHTGLNGLQEVLKRGVLDRVIKNSRIAEETQVLEKFFEQLAKKGKITYGLSYVTKAVESGAVETLLISEDIVRANESLLEGAEKISAKIMIISPEHESGKRFAGLGGIGAFLRYRVE
jgi:protein pelota